MKPLTWAAAALSLCLFAGCRGDADIDAGHPQTEAGQSPAGSGTASQATHDATNTGVQARQHDEATKAGTTGEGHELPPTGTGDNSAAAGANIDAAGGGGNGVSPPKGQPAGDAGRSTGGSDAGLDKK
jgi:hypothetical protein